ncbi:MAG: TraI/MobA(P) family conjugative relaxase [Polyangiales bacterium]
MGNGFPQLARYIRGQSHAPRATWFLAANLPAVITARDVQLACRLVEAVQAQNTRAGKARTYHLVISLHPEDRSLDRRELRRVVEHLVDVLGFSEHQYIAARHNDKDHEHIHVAINKIHPETFRMHSPAWDHQKLIAAGRVLEMELGLTPLRTVARERENLPERAADCEAHQGIDSFARWARKTLAPALRATELRSWDDLHSVCGRCGVVVRLHGNGLVFEDAEQGIRVKASCVGRNFSKPRLCKQLGNFRPPPGHQLEDAGRVVQRYSPMPAMVPESLWKDYTQLLERGRLEREDAWNRYRGNASRDRRRLKEKYRHQRWLLGALPVSNRDRKRLSQQLALRQAIESRNLGRKLASQPKAIQKSPHPGSWRDFVAGSAATRDARAIRLLQRREQQRGSHDLERGS